MSYALFTLLALALCFVAVLAYKRTRRLFFHALAVTIDVVFVSGGSAIVRWSAPKGYGRASASGDAHRCLVRLALCQVLVLRLNTRRARWAPP
jgi:hypothetical protein